MISISNSPRVAYDVYKKIGGLETEIGTLVERMRSIRVFEDNQNQDLRVSIEELRLLMEQERRTVKCGCSIF